MPDSAPQPRTTCLLLNPGARNGRAEEEVRAAVAEHLPGAEVRLTREAGHATELAREAAEAGCETVVAAGGDGTINEVVNGLGEHLGKVRLGIVPLGTGNDLARTLGLPEGIDAAVASLAAGRTRRLDVGRLEHDGGSRLFLNLSAGGFSGEVSGRLTAEVKRAWGPLAYLRAAVETLPEVQGYQVELRCDGGEAQRLEALNVVVAHGRYVAAGIPVAPEAEPADGLFDLLVLEACPLPVFTALAAKILAGTHLEGETPHLTFRRARTVEIRSHPPMPFNADGEPVGETPLRFELLPRALEVVTAPA